MPSEGGYAKSLNIWELFIFWLLGDKHYKGLIGRLFCKHEWGESSRTKYCRNFAFLYDDGSRRIVESKVCKKCHLGKHKEWIEQ